MKIAREGWPFILPLLVTGALAWLFLPDWTALLFVPPVLFTVWFFRDPERTPPRQPGLLISPADGKIIVAGPRRVSIFMNVFNVHVCRAPASGEVVSIVHTPGRFLAAMKDAASEHNERVEILLRDEAAELRFTLVAGLIARRIVCKVVEGQRLTIGDRVGLIRFGSRVDVDLPPGATCAVRLGDKVVAGETTLARLAAERKGASVEPAGATSV